MSVAFSSSDKEAIERKVEGVTDVTEPTSRDQLKERYDLSGCASWIKEKGFRTVALQFPDNLLMDSVSVTLKLQEESNADLYILGDTSYGSCCVDEVAAEHVKAEAIIHFGHSCLSIPTRLPVCYVFGKLNICVMDIVEQFKQTFQDLDSHVIIMYDVQCSHIIAPFYDNLRKSYQNLVLSNLMIPGQENISKVTEGLVEIRKCSRSFRIKNNLSVSDYSVFFIGPENRTQVNLIMTFNECPFWTFLPSLKTVRKESVDVNKSLRKRFYLIERIKDAKIIGILVGTLGVQNYVLAIDNLKALIKKAGKKSYTLAVGKVNVAKLANFEEIDIYVYVACPENTFLNSKEFYRPIVTPFEAELALNPSRPWTTTYVADFNELLPGRDHYIEPCERESEPDVSLISGHIRSMGLERTENVAECSSIVPKENTVAIPVVHAGGAGEYLQTRTWQGLEQKLGQTEVSKITKGKSGIAYSYEDEGNNN